MKSSFAGLWVMNTGGGQNNYSKLPVNILVTGTNVIDWIISNSANEYALTNPPVISNKTAFLVLMKMPTNYFENTPYRGLDGLGPFTNDTTVGRPYGWVTSYTTNGGTNFPSGRTNWYTTDYGMDGLRTITNLMVFQDRAPLWGQVGGQIGEGVSDTAWLTAVANATNGWPNLGDPLASSELPQQGAWGQHYSDNWWASAYSINLGFLRQSNISTNLTVPPALSVIVTTNATGYSYGFFGYSSTNSTYDAFNTGLTSGKSVVTGEWASAGASRVYAYRKDFTNPPPTFCDDPDTFTSLDSVRGWEATAVGRWYISPEFKFR
jgi:hypothetical protein